jgi:hypothetical protein
MLDVTTGSRNPWSFGDLLHHPGAVALACAWAGWRVFPLGRDKRPAIRNWPTLATTDPRTIDEWFAPCGWVGQPERLVGVMTGPESGIWVLDIDVKSANGFATARDLLGAQGVTHRPATFVVRTPSGGEHWYFAWPDDGRVIGNSASGRLGPGLDSRGWHGYVVAPSSPGYVVLDGTLPPVPAWRWLEDLVEKRPYVETPRSHGEPAGELVRASLRATVANLASVASGGRNGALNRAAWGLARLGIDREAAWAALRQACEVNGLVADDGAERCRATFESGWRAGRGAMA